MLDGISCVATRPGMKGLLCGRMEGGTAVDRARLVSISDGIVEGYESYLSQMTMSFVDQRNRICNSWFSATS